jgi:hypothetical protein
MPGLDPRIQTSEVYRMAASSPGHEEIGGPFFS